MDKQPVGQLPDLTQSNNDDEIMVITNSEYNQLKKEKISDFITDLQSTNTNNSLTTGSDGKLFVSKTINASDVDGVLSLDNIPQLSTNKLPETGISADNYSYPSSITVNDRGQVVSIVEGSAAEAGAYLDQSQITNCILEAPNGVATYSGSTITVKQGLKFLIPNGRNADKTLNNIETILPNDISRDVGTSSNGTYIALVNNTEEVYTIDYVPLNTYYESSVKPTSSTARRWLDTENNYFYGLNSGVQQQLFITKVLTFVVKDGQITSFTPYQPVELAKNTDVVHNTGDENIEGEKNFELIRTNTLFSNGTTAFRGSTPVSYNADFGYIAQSTEIDMNVTPSAAQYMGYDIRDKNGQRLAYFGYRKSNKSDNSDSQIVIQDQSGNNRFRFPRCTSRPSTKSTAADNRVAVVVQNYLNGTSWYRVWSDGFIEQAGQVSMGGTNPYTVALLRKFSTNTYYVIIQAGSRGTEQPHANQIETVFAPTTANFKFVGNYNNMTVFWYACGY